MTPPKSEPKYFIDLFAGCGGLSLGLMKAGWNGLFAVEKSPLAFATLRHNLIDPATRWCFNWPDWFPKSSIDIQDFLINYDSQLHDLKGHVKLVAGGPPCQGFSFAGRRDSNDERNCLVDAYLKVVETIEPDLVLLENVQGITVAFKDREDGKVTASEELLSGAEGIKQALGPSYYTFDSIIKAVVYGVPQYRPRYIMIAVKKSLGMT